MNALLCFITFAATQITSAILIYACISLINNNFSSFVIIASQTVRYTIFLRLYLIQGSFTQNLVGKQTTRIILIQNYLRNCTIFLPMMALHNLDIKDVGSNREP